jgi:sugar/nucleoside kinase (ribokinase family)
MLMAIAAGYLNRWFGKLMTIYSGIGPQKKLVVGVGSALVDILAREDDAFVDLAGAIKGGMTYVDQDFIDATVAKTTTAPETVPGGSACNTAVGIGQLGGSARFVGKCGSDPMGQMLNDSLKKQNVEPFLLASSAPTGRVLSIITPDAQRSMLTFLGAASEIRPEEITSACFDNAAIVHIEGYLLFNRDLMVAVLQAAKKAGACISLDLASFNVVEEAADILPDLIQTYVDILIANEDEIRAYTGIQDESRALDAFASQVDLGVLKLGGRGSLIAFNDRQIKIDSVGDGDVIDTTGAGDLWAAGFLFGLVNRFPLSRCGALGSHCGYAVCRVVGANIPESQWTKIRELLEA